MDFLIDEEITVETINNIEDSNEMGLIYKLEIFLVDVEKIKKAFNEYDASVLVQLINEDINAINFL